MAPHGILLHRASESADVVQHLQRARDRNGLPGLQNAPASPFRGHAAQVERVLLRIAGKRATSVVPAGPASSPQTAHGTRRYRRTTDPAG